MATEIKSVEFKILSVDGGGIKGLFSACVLCEIEKANGRLTDYFRYDLWHIHRRSYCPWPGRRKVCG